MRTASATLEGGDGVQCDTLRKCSTRFLRRGPRKPMLCTKGHQEWMNWIAWIKQEAAKEVRRALSWMAAVVATTWTFHGSPAHVAPFQFLAAWSAKDAYIGGEGYAMTSAHVLRQAVHWPHIRQCLPWHTQLLHQGWTLLGHIMFCNGFVFVFQFCLCQWEPKHFPVLGFVGTHTVGPCMFRPSSFH